VLDGSKLECESWLTVEKLRIAYAAGLDHPVDIPIKGSSVRIGKFVKIIESTGQMPLPPAILWEGRGFEVLDGYHRVAALFHVQTNSAATEHEVWIARSAAAITAQQSHA
jgi:hypothetical protein